MFNFIFNIFYFWNKMCLLNLAWPCCTLPQLLCALPLIRLVSINSRITRLPWPPLSPRPTEFSAIFTALSSWRKKIPHSPTATSTSYADARGSVSCGSDVREKIGRREVDRSVSAKAGAAGCGEVWGTLAPAPAGPIGSRWPVRSSCAGAAASSGSSAG